MGWVRYIIIGAGAVGGTIGGCLFQGGHDVVLVARGAHLAALRADGLKLATPMGSHQLGIPAASGPDALGLRDGDVLILAVKGRTRPRSWRSGPGSPPVPGRSWPRPCRSSARRMAWPTKASRCAGSAGCTGCACGSPPTHLEPGTVESQGTPLAGMLPVGRYPSGVDATIEQIAADLASSRFGTLVSDDVMRWKYAKLLGNLGNSIEALCGSEGRHGDAARELRDRTRAEALAVFAAAGIGYASAEEIAAARGDQVRTGAVNGSSRAGGSSWQSLSRGTGTIEADFLNGEIVLLGRRARRADSGERGAAEAGQPGRADRTAPGSTTPAEILSRQYPKPSPDAHRPGKSVVLRTPGSVRQAYRTAGEAGIASHREVHAQPDPLTR